MIDQTITVGNIIEVFVLLGGGAVIFVTLKRTVEQLTSDVSDLKADIKALNKVVVAMAVADQRILALEQDLRELRHGRGFVREDLTREYP